MSNKVYYVKYFECWIDADKCSKILKDKNTSVYISEIWGTWILSFEFSIVIHMCIDVLQKISESILVGHRNTKKFKLYLPQVLNFTLMLYLL